MKYILKYILNEFLPAAVTPFEVFVFSDASPVTPDKSSASGLPLLKNNSYTSKIKKNTEHQYIIDALA